MLTLKLKEYMVRKFIHFVFYVKLMFFVNKRFQCINENFLAANTCSQYEYKLFVFYRKRSPDICQTL